MALSLRPASLQHVVYGNGLQDFVVVEDKIQLLCGIPPSENVRHIRLRGARSSGGLLAYLASLRDCFVYYERNSFPYISNRH